MSDGRPPQSAGRGAARAALSWAAVVLVVTAAVVAAAQTGQGRMIISSVQRFLLFYSGVFALVALTAAVAAGLAGTDRILLSPGRRILAQAVHRALAVVAVAALATHIVLEVLAHRSDAVDAVVPFAAHGRTLYIGLGTVASDLLVLIVATSLVRGRFAGRRPWAWRPVHALSYLAWVLSILHGLLAGRTAKPYVDWSYGGCVALVALALLIRLRTGQRRGPAIPSMGRHQGGRQAAGSGPEPAGMLLLPAHQHRAIGSAADQGHRR